jgi:hypothetical protein
MNVNSCNLPTTLVIIFGALLAVCLFPDAYAQSGILDFPSNSFSDSTSTQDKNQFTNVVPNQTSGFSKFTNTEYGFEFEFPSDWEVRDPISSGLSMEGIPVQVAMIRSPADGGIHDLMTISVQEPSRYLDTDAMEVKTSNLSSQEQARIVTDMLPEYGFKIVRENPVTVADLPAYRIEYTTYEYETEIFVVKPDGTLYKLEFGTPMLRAPESLPVFNKMIDSFKFINSSSIINSTQPEGLTQNIPQSSINDSAQTSLSTDLGSSNNDFTTFGPVAQIQQFDHDTGGGPVCCDTNGAASSNQPTGSNVPIAPALSDDLSNGDSTDEGEEDNDDNSGSDDDDDDDDDENN